MANKLQSPTASFASKLKTPSIPNEYEAFSGVLPGNVASGVKLPDAEKAFAPFKKTPLPDDTKLYQDLNVKTGVGGFGEGHTVPEIKKGMNERAFRPELLGEMYDAKRQEQQLVDSSFDTRLAQEADSSLFKNTDILNLESTVGDIKLAKMKAANDVNSFLTNPNSIVRKTFEKNLGKAKLEEYNSLISKKDTYVAGLTTDKSDAFLSSGIRGYFDLPVINTIVNKATGGEYEAFTSAISEMEAQGTEGLTQKGSYYTANLLGGALEFSAFSAIGELGLFDGLSSAGLKIGGSAGNKMVKVASNLETLSMKSPTLFAATVDNGMSAAIQYGIDSSIGGSHSNADFVNNLYMGAVMPVAFHGALKGISGSYKAIKGVIPRDITNLEKAIAEDMKVNGSMDAKSAMRNLEESFVFNDNKTLGEKIAEYKAEMGGKNPDMEVSHEQVMTELAAKGVSISKGGAKRVAKSINELNGKLKLTTEGNRIGEMSADDNIQMTKQSVMQKLTQEPIVDSNKADDILSTTHKENGVEYTQTKVDEADKLDDLMHNPEFSPTKLDEANTIDEVAKVVEGKSAKTTVKEIETARENIDIHNLKSPEDIKLMAEKEGVKFDSDKAISKENVLNTDYLHKIVNDIESNVIGFTKYATKISKEFIAKAKSEAKDIKEFGRLKLKPRELGNEGAAIVKRLTVEMNDAIKSLKSANTLAQKNSLKKKIAEIKKLKDSHQKAIDSKNKTIDKKNAQIEKIKLDKSLTITQKNKKIEEIRQSNINKNADRRALISLGKSEIDIGGNLPDYRGLSTQRIIAIKNEFKARILNKSTLEELEQIIVEFHKKVYTEAYKSVDKQIEKVIKKIKSEKKGASVDVAYRNKIIETYNSFKEGTETSNLVKLQETLESIKSFAKEGRDVHKETVDMRKQTTQILAEKALSELEASGKDKYGMRLLNTEEGNKGQKSWFQSLRGWAEGAIQTQTQMTRLFEGRFEIINGVKKWIENPLNKIFNIDLQRAASKVKAIESQLMDKWIPKLSKSLQEGLGGGDAKSNMTLYHLWKVRNRGFNDYNLRDLLFMRKDSRGNWEYVPTMTPTKFRKTNASEIAAGNIIDFRNANIETKQQVLDSVYRRFDNMYADKNSLFHSADNDWRAHAVSNGLHLKNIMTNEFNQNWIPDGDNYWPIIHSNKSGDTEIINDIGGIEDGYRRSINDSFTKEMEGAKGELSMYHDPVSIVQNHINGNIYYGQMISPLRRAQTLLNAIRKGNAAINSKNIDILMQSITQEVKVEGDKINPFSIDFLTKDEGQGSDSLLTPEMDRFINDHIKKVATNGISLGGKLDMNGSRVLDTIYQNLYNTALSGIGTPLKQPLSLLTATVEGGTRNMVSAARSLNGENISILFNDSGTLYERMPPIVNSEGVGKSMRNTSHESLTNRAGDVINDVMNNTVGNAIKTMDGAVSLQTFLVGVSKYLDENHPELHTKGKQLNLKKIKEVLSPEQWDDVLGFSENFMDRVMSSQNKVNAGLGTGNPLTKIALFLGKTGLNETTLFLESIHKLFQSKYGTSDKARLAVAILVTNYVNQYYNHKVDDIKNKFDETVGAKTPEQIGDSFYSWSGKHIAKDKVTEGDRFAAGLVYFISTRMMKPSSDFDFLKGTKSITNYVSKMDSYPTTGRKVEEGVYALMGSFIHRNIPDAGRFLLTEGLQSVGVDKDFTKVGNTKYDDAVNAIYSSILKDRAPEEGGNKPSIMEQFNGITAQGDIIPTGQSLNDLIPTQTSISESKSALSQEQKLVTSNRKAIINGYKNQNNVSYKGFIQYIKSNSDKLSGAGITQENLFSTVDSMYGEILTDSNRSEGSIDSLLSGAPVRVIFDVRIAPLLKSGDITSAKMEVKRLKDKNVIKSTSGISQIQQLIIDSQTKR